MKVAPARTAALKTLRAIREGAFADHALDRHARELADADRRLAQELVYGVQRLRGRLDYLIDCLVTSGLASLEPDVLDVLRLGAYQLLELDRVPAYAVVDEAVEAARGASGAGAGGLTNAVLRRLSREPDACSFPRPEQDALGYLASWGSHPRWLLERWRARWSLEAVERLVEYNNRQPAVYVTVIDRRDRAVDRLRAVGIGAEAAELGWASVRIDSGQVGRAIETISAVVQDPGAAAVVDFAALAPGVDVVEFCAAPGGKAALLAARGYRVWALDVSPQRVRRLAENRTRLGLARLHIAVADSTRPPLANRSAVLLDAPCSGTGTLARHPDARWRLRPADLRTLAELQRRLLEAAAETVTPGGTLVYATCSLEPEENEGQVELFLKRRADFERDPPPAGSVPAELLAPNGDLRVLPQEHGIDGAYAARLRRRAD